MTVCKQERFGARLQVIIVPIFWNKRVHEKREVVEAAETVLRLLEGAGFNAGCDTTTTLSPGQKFRHWEEQGVTVRVEIGPKEASSRSCLLAICSTPGQVAARSTVHVRIYIPAMPSLLCICPSLTSGASAPQPLAPVILVVIGDHLWAGWEALAGCRTLCIASASRQRRG